MYLQESIKNIQNAGEQSEQARGRNSQNKVGRAPSSLINVKYLTHKNKLFPKLTTTSNKNKKNYKI